ncbi:MAG: metal-dependent hydrolase [Syntrophobacterales bacterium]|nr:metal-dependent hydrolase [Syntrophobacterales bacterium]
MDYITHIVTGATGYRLITSRSLHEVDHIQDNKITLISGGLFFLASILPDCDNISRLWGMEAYIVHHRGITHSIPFSLVASAILATLFLRKLLSLSSFAVAFSAATLGMIFHIYMDLITSYGTQVLLPFTDRRFSLDWVFIVDPIYTLVIVSIFALSSILLKKTSKTTYLSWIFVGWILLYPAICGFTKYYANSLWHQIGTSHHLALLPDFGTPLIWKLIVKNDNVYRIASVNLIRKSVTFDPQEFIVLDNSFASKVSKKVDSFRIYRWFAVYPYQKLREENGKERIIEVGDLRFFSPLKVLKNRRPIPPFTIFLKLHGSEVSLYYRFPPPLSLR